MKLDPDTQRAIAERVKFYRELGFYDLYRREVAPVSASAATSEIAAANDQRPPTNDLLPATDQRPTTNDSSDDMPKAKAQKSPTPLPVIQGTPEEMLAAISADIGDCKRCVLHKGRTKLVFGVGSPRAELMFIGEGPGADEDAQGIPFVGRAGQLLTNMIKAMGLSRDNVYIANVVKCRPPGNRTPERDECDTCGPFLMRQVAAIRPKVIVALGATAAKYLLDINDSMGNLRGQWYDFTPPASATGGAPIEPIKLAVTYHPAYLLRDPRQKGEAWKDLQMVMKELGLKPPPKD
jgi:uracil-DNA glycosylase